MPILIAEREKLSGRFRYQILILHNLMNFVIKQSRQPAIHPSSTSKYIFTKEILRTVATET